MICKTESITIFPSRAYLNVDQTQPSIAVKIIRYSNSTFCLEIGELGARFRVDMDENDFSTFVFLATKVLDNYTADMYADSEV